MNDGQHQFFQHPVNQPLPIDFQDIKKILHKVGNQIQLGFKKMK